MILSNPRTTAEFPDWPLGGQRRGLCKFFVETHSKKGQRVGRQTANPNGGMNAVKYSTYHPRAVIVDGDDGRTYLLEDVSYYGFITIRNSDFSVADSVHDSSHQERYAELLALFV